MRLLQTFVDGNIGHGAGFVVGAGVGLGVGAAVGFDVGAVVGAAVGFIVGALVGAKVGFAVGPAVGAVVGAGVLPGLPVARGPFAGPFWPAIEVGSATTSFEAVDGGMAVGPTAARVVEPAIDDCGPPIAAPVRTVPPSPAHVVSRTADTATSASRTPARGDRRSIAGSVAEQPDVVDDEVVRGTWC
jgi:hypothetical protein